MAFNGSGVHNRVHDWTQDLTNTIPVTASRMDAEHDDISTALSSVICRDGQSTTTARIPFGAGLSAAAGATSSVAYAQTNDLNTGMYFPATDQWGLVAGGTAVAVGTASGVAVTGAFSTTGAVTLSDALALTGNLAINTNKFTVTAASGNTAIAGTLGVTGDVAVNTNKFTIAASSGNTAVAGTFGVTGASTFGAAVTVSAGGAAIIGSSSVTGSLTVSSNFTVSGGTVSLPVATVADAALATPGCMKLILSQTASGSATIDFNQTNAAAAFNGTYKRLMVVISSIKPATNDVELWFRVGTGAGPTYQTTGYSYANDASIPGAAGNPTGASASRIIVAGDGASNRAIGNGTGEKYCGTLWFDAPELSDIMPVWYEGGYMSADTQWYQYNGSGAYTTAGAITAIRFMMESGNIASGTFALYGIKNS